MIGCTSVIKDEKTAKEQPDKDTSTVVEFRPEPTPVLSPQDVEDLIGYWVGWFEPDLTDDERQRLYDKEIYPSANKINISIDDIQGDRILGHSVVANNYREFRGVIKVQNDTFIVNASEDGTDKQDGVFDFYLVKEDSVLNGSWTAYNKSLNVPNRSYKLTKEIFKYTPANSLFMPYIDYEKIQDVREVTRENVLDFYKSEDDLILTHFELNLDTLSNLDYEVYLKLALEYENEFRDSRYFTITQKVFEKNASTDTLSGEFVSELSKADIYVLRNSIFARHGYSFKKEDLRRYFDRYSWYIPVHANITTDVTELEKYNIQMLLAYEEHAEEYYDEFGR